MGRCGGITKSLLLKKMVLHTISFFSQKGREKAVYHPPAKRPAPLDDSKEEVRHLNKKREEEEDLMLVSSQPQSTSRQANDNAPESSDLASLLAAGRKIRADAQLLDPESFFYPR